MLSKKTLEELLQAAHYVQSNFGWDDDLNNAVEELEDYLQSLNK